MTRAQRVLIVLAVASVVAVPGCFEIDGMFPWNWHVPKKLKEYDRLPGQSDVERKRERDAQSERERLAPGRAPGDTLAPAKSG